MPFSVEMSAFGLSSLSLGLLIAVVYGQSYTLTVLEEQPSNTLVGSIQNDPQFVKSVSSVNRTALRFMFFGQRNPWINSFRMEQVSGIIYTRTPLDRELVCPDATSECYQDFDVAVHSDEVFKILKLKIVIEDINDNPPQFPETEVTINVPESAPVDFKVPIRGATDKDTGMTHGVQSYEIIPSDGQFTVSVIENLDGSPEVGIVVGRKLDRELISSHSVEVLAKDGGVPPKTGTVKVTILVTDANDHSPTFSRSVYNITLEENIPVNSSVIQVHAADRDTGMNGRVRFRFSSRTASKFSDVFKIDVTSGEISVSGTVDYETVPSYRLVVEAVDQGAQPLTAQALVLVNLIDMNDNAPSLRYNFIPRGDHAVVSENANINDFVAHVSALDRDSGENAEVDCTIDNQAFKLERLYDNEFQINLGIKLDRETKAVYNVTILCDDRGRPSLTVAGYFRVTVSDENDNSPQFDTPSYVVTVNENITIGEDVVQVSATDNDIGQNGKVIYELHGADSAYFGIQRFSGMVFLRQKLDYEDAPNATFTVTASDSADSPRQTNVTIVVMILDVNDEHPEFNQTFYGFRVEENSPKGTVVGSVFASDPDLGLGGRVVYSVREAPESTGMFTVSAEDGLIKTTQEIDRETNPSIRFFVLATDKGDNPLTSTVGVTVDILDVNDNSPLVRLSSTSNRSVSVSTDQPPETPFVKVVAEDPDDGDNGTLSFAIEAGDPKSFFGINAINGEMFLRLNTSSGDGLVSQEIVSVLISVKDHGSPQRVTLKRFNITVLPTTVPGSAAREADGLPNNFIIMIAVICATTFLSVIIIVTIFIIRRQNQREAVSGYTDSKESQPEKSNTTKVNTPVESNSNHTNGKTKKGVNFVFQTEHGLLSQESSTDPPSKMAVHKPRPAHDVIRQPKSLATQNSLNLLWLDGKPEPGRLPSEDHSSNIVTPHNIPATAKLWLHGPRGDDETSNVSGETVTSDSGRGGSEDDAHSRRLYPMDEQDSLTRGVHGFGSEGEYVDMQRSPLSYMAAVRKYDSLNQKLPDHYLDILKRKSGHREASANMASCKADNSGHDHQCYTKMSPLGLEERAESPPPPIPRRQQLSPRVQDVPCKRVQLSEPVTRIDVGKICRSFRRPDMNRSIDSLVTKSDLTVTTYDDDSATTTSGSYTIDDLSEGESQGPQTACV